MILLCACVVPRDVVGDGDRANEGRVTATKRKLAEEQHELAMAQMQYTEVRVEGGTARATLALMVCAVGGVPQRSWWGRSE